MNQNESNDTWTLYNMIKLTYTFNDMDAFESFLFS